MNDKEKLQELINDLKKQLQEAQEKFENLSKTERFEPNENEIYWLVNSLCNVVAIAFDNNLQDDIRRYETFNCFRTREDAEREANKILIRRKLEDIARRLNGDKEIDWSNENQRKYFINYYFSEGLCIDWNTYMCVQGCIYCLDEKFLDIAKEEIGEQELKDYIIGE